jgi:hypothetical protein
MRIIKKLAGLILLCTISLTFIGCVYGESFSDANEELTVFTGRNFSNYMYSEKVVVHISDSTSKDFLSLATTDAKEDDSWVTFAEEVLSGRFKKVGWNDFKLFILMDDKYYVLDINAYEVPELDKNGNPKEIEYELIEYSNVDFKAEFPDYKSYDWWNAH